MTKSFYAIIIFFSFVFNISADDLKSFRAFIDPIMDNRIMDADEENMNDFKTDNIKQAIISELNHQAESSDENEKKYISACIQVLETNNYEIQNIISLDPNEYFINYQIRTNSDEIEKMPDTDKALGPYKFLHFITFKYDSDKKTLSDIATLMVAYSELNFQKYEYEGKTVLYCIINASSFGMGTSELYLDIIDPFDMHEILSENILYIQNFYSEVYEDIENFIRFRFAGNSIEFNGAVYDESEKKYVDYFRTVKVFR